ncbi:class I SAM-dependent methyltransferase [Francisella philomiragia]|uniref:class I SAM-dependent methyltransferase n=1 Tax=Francisella philomiragia TaxID=28110 RepID=UPI0019083FC2|nr:methyltransferase domain-containing protein [Francisella philomiragia]MBK2025184.1 class I SAM-dependent methyltransferase [Francisella philomiragia]
MKKILKKLPIIRTLVSLNNRSEKVEKLLNEFIKISDWQYRDLLEIVSRDTKIKHNKSISIKTNFPIAYESDDHQKPFGTARDNTRSMRFTKKCIEEYGNELSFLDLGCSGGGLVFDFAIRGYDAIGVEGSDYSKKYQRCNWRSIPNNLFTCDITKPFDLLENGVNKKFKVISCWEVFEHIDVKDLSNVYCNVRKHLDNDGIFIGSISRCDKDPLHCTLQTKDWWANNFSENGLEFLSQNENHFEFLDYARGVQGGMFDSHNYQTNPEKGFHFVAKLKL